jgi:hypothetical protein
LLAKNFLFLVWFATLLLCLAEEGGQEQTPILVWIWLVSGYYQAPVSSSLLYQYYTKVISDRIFELGANNRERFLGQKRHNNGGVSCCSVLLSPLTNHLIGWTAKCTRVQRNFHFSIEQ